MNKFSVKNFRVFGSEGVTIEHKPITLLTGTNSSGKSSYVKALVLLKEYIDKIRNDFNKDGSFNPAKYTLDFTKADLKLNGFSSVLNKDAKKDALITFSLDLDMGFLFGNYRTEYSFCAGKDSKGLDTGILHSIRVICDEELVLSTIAEGDSLKIDYANVGSATAQRFKCYEFLYVLPKMILKNHINEYGDFDYDFIKDGDYDLAKITATEQGKRVHKLQQELFGSPEEEIFLGGTGSLIADSKSLEELDKVNLTDNLEALVDTNLLFYFPVLEKLRGKSREECLRILSNEAKCCNIIAEYFPKDNPMESFDRRGQVSDQPSILAQLIEHFKMSKYESFIDYFRELEDKQLKHVNKDQRIINRMGEKFDFIKDTLMQSICVNFCDSFFRITGDLLPEFKNAYYVLSAWQWHEDGLSSPKGDKVYDDNTQFIKRYADNYRQQFMSSTVLFENYKIYLEYIFRHSIMPDSLTLLTYFNGSFSTVQRLHTFEENSILTRSVTQYLENTNSLNGLKKSIRKSDMFIPGSFLNKWLKEFEIGKELIIDLDEEGLGFKLRVKKDDGRIESLADQGHGVTQMVTILLVIENEILGSLISKYELDTIDSVQSYSSAKHLVVLEEPEVSMHPCMQSKLADMLNAACKFDVQFIIETHSEYLVRKTQAIVARMNNEEYENNPFVVYYFNRDGSAYDMEYTESGRFANSFGTGFFDEAGKSSIEILRREKEAKK